MSFILFNEVPIFDIFPDLRLFPSKGFLHIYKAFLDLLPQNKMISTDNSDKRYDGKIM